MKKDVVVNKPHSAAGELLVRYGDCTGPVAAALSLAPAIGNFAVTQLPATALVVPEDAGRTGDFCFSFTRRSAEPIWVIDWIELSGTRNVVTH
jgi:hypothetical protein